MTAALVHGDQISCSRVGGGMRRESSKLRQHAGSLAEALGELAGWEGAEAEHARGAIADSLQALQTLADVLDGAGTALQRYTTDLAAGHELGRRAELRVNNAGLLLEGTRVIEPWGPASSHESEWRRSQVPEVQARVDLATAHVGRARGQLSREMARLSQSCRETPVPALRSKVSTMTP
jgi:hypothetical protein